jgi:hypothetical protein
LQDDEASFRAEGRAQYGSLVEAPWTRTARGLTTTRVAMEDVHHRRLSGGRDSARGMSQSPIDSVQKYL